MGMTTAGPGSDTGGRRRITVINDNPDFLGLMREVLGEDSGYQVTTIDGDTIRDVEPIRESRPDLLVIDLRWRQDGLSGWDILLAIRHDHELRGLPIILCTGDLQALEEHAAEIVNDPNVETLRKPFKVKDLEALVSRFIGQPTPL